MAKWHPGNLRTRRQQLPLHRSDRSSETEIIPDEIHFMITIKEYWQEEFEKKSKPEDYQTKVPVNEIEHNLMSALKQAGIDPSDIRPKK